MNRIKAKDLRIGNVVYSSKGELAIVKSILTNPTLDMVEVSEFGGDEDDVLINSVLQIVPCSLNENKLKRVGFDRLPGGMMYNLDTDFTLYTKGEQQRFEDLLIPPFYWGEYSRGYWGSVNFVHELQNIHYFVTGKELDPNKLINN